MLNVSVGDFLKKVPHTLQKLLNNFIYTMRTVRFLRTVPSGALGPNSQRAPVSYKCEPNGTYFYETPQNWELGPNARNGTFRRKISRRMPLIHFQGSF